MVSTTELIVLKYKQIYVYNTKYAVIWKSCFVYWFPRKLTEVIILKRLLHAYFISYVYLQENCKVIRKVLPIKSAGVGRFVADEK